MCPVCAAFPAPPCSFDTRLGTVLGYCPIIRPREASIPRQIAYLENTPIPGPDADPDGWKWLAPLSVRGSVFSTRTVDATCTVRLPRGPRGPTVPPHATRC